MNNKKSWSLIVYIAIIAAVIVAYIIGIPKQLEQQRQEKYNQTISTPTPYEAVEGVQ